MIPSIKIKLHSNLAISLVVLITTILMVILNEINLSHLYPEYPYKDGLITTADEYSYFFPAESLYQTGEWIASGDGSKAYLRTPGYGFFYLIALVIGQSKAFLVLKILQISCFAGTLFLLFKILCKYISRQFSLVATIIFGLLPCFHGFTYYTLSESVIPFFMLWWVFSIIKPRKIDFVNLFLSTSLLVLIRPQLIVFPIIFVVYYLIRKNKRSIYLLAGLMPFLLWQLRTATIIGHWPDLHPVYSLSNNSIFRPPHQKLTELFKIWEHESDVFHENMGVLSADSSEIARNKVAATIPVHFHQDVLPILKEFQLLRYRQGLYTSIKINDYLPGEKELTERIDELTFQLKSENKIDYFIFTPLKSLKKLLFTSMMNLNVFQEAWKDNILVLALKILSFTLILLGFIHSFFFCFTPKQSIEIRLLAFAVLISIFYLAYFQRLNEERYLYPYLGLFFIFTCLFTYNLLKRYQKESRPKLRRLLKKI